MSWNPIGLLPIPQYCPDSSFAGWDNGRLCQKDNNKVQRLVDGKLVDYTPAVPAPASASPQAPAAAQGVKARKMSRKSCSNRNMKWISKNKHSKGYCRKNNSKSRKSRKSKSRKSRKGKSRM